MPSRTPSTVKVVGVGDVCARLFAIMDSKGFGDGGGAPTEVAAPMEMLVTKLPVVIGRSRAATHPEEQFFRVDDNRVSREHAVIDWDADAGCFFVKCLSRNGMDVNGA